MNFIKWLSEIISPNRKYRNCIENHFGTYLKEKGYSKLYDQKLNKYIFENQFRIIEIQNNTHPADYGFSVFIYNKLIINEYSILISIPNYLIYSDLTLIKDSFHALLANKKATDSIETKNWNQNLKVFWLKENLTQNKKIVRIV